MSLLQMIANGGQFGAPATGFGSIATPPVTRLPIPSNGAPQNIIPDFSAPPAAGNGASPQTMAPATGMGAAPGAQQGGLMAQIMKLLGGGGGGANLSQLLGLFA